MTKNALLPVIAKLTYHLVTVLVGASLGGSDGRESSCGAGDPEWIPESGRSPGEGNGNPLQDSCLENPLDRGAWRATVHGGHKESDTTGLWTYLCGILGFPAVPGHFGIGSRLLLFVLEQRRCNEAAAVNTHLAINCQTLFRSLDSPL